MNLNPFDQRDLDYTWWAQKPVLSWGFGFQVLIYCLGKKTLLLFLCLFFFAVYHARPPRCPWFFAAIQPQASAEPNCLHTFSTMHSHTHTLTPTQAFATHYAHTYVFHIFRHLPHSTLSYSLRYLHVRTHTRFQQPITGRQRILNADTGYIARTSKLTTQYISTTRTRSHLYGQLLRTIRTHTHASSHR